MMEEDIAEAVRKVKLKSQSLFRSLLWLTLQQTLDELKEKIVDGVWKAEGWSQNLQQSLFLPMLQEMIQKKMEEVEEEMVEKVGKKCQNLQRSLFRSMLHWNIWEMKDHIVEGVLKEESQHHQSLLSGFDHPSVRYPASLLQSLQASWKI